MKSLYSLFYNMLLLIFVWQDNSSFLEHLKLLKIINVYIILRYKNRTYMIVKEMKKISMDLILVILEKDNQRTLYGFFFKGDLV